MSFQEKLEIVQNEILLAMDKHPKVTFRENLIKIEEMTGYSRAWLLIGIAVSIVFIFILFGGFLLVSRLVGFLYPAYASFKNINNPVAKDSELLLSYWVIFGSLIALNPILRPFTDFVPFFNLWKTGLLMWCYNPHYRGASVICKEFFRPHLLPGIGFSSEVTAIPKDFNSESKSKSIGDDESRFEIEVICAEGLPEVEDEPHFYVSAFLQNKVGEMISNKCKTRAKKSLNPQWEEKIVVRFREIDAAGPGNSIKFNVFQKESLGQDILVCSAAIPIAQVESNFVGEFDLKSELEGESGKVVSFLRLKLNKID